MNSIRFSISNVYFVLLGLLLLYLGHNKVKIGSYSRHVTGNGFVIESKMADLLAALLGVMTVSAVFLLFISITLFYFCIRWTRMATPGN